MASTARCSGIGKAVAPIAPSMIAASTSSGVPCTCANPSTVSNHRSITAPMS